MRVSRLGLGLAVAGCLAAPATRAASPEVAAAETSLSISLGATGIDYKEDIRPQTDKENGAVPGIGVAMSGLVPYGANTDLYSYLGYSFSAGPIGYNGFTQPVYQKLNATDNAVFNRIEARLGVGVPLQSGAEVIPFIAGGYQAWNRNVDSKITIDGGEFYHAYLVGAGVKLDVPVNPQLIVSGTVEAFGMFGAHIENDGIGFSDGLGNAGEEKITLGADYAITPRWHTFADAYFEHFNYAGSKPDYNVFPGFYVIEPISTTYQYGGDVGVGFSFN
jgi:hypothetical protein